jgi:hypothetical protein
MERLSLINPCPASNWQIEYLKKELLTWLNEKSGRRAQLIPGIDEKDAFI